MASEKSQLSIFTTRTACGAAEAAAVRRDIERQQKRLADGNLLQLRYMTDVSHDTDTDIIGSGVLEEMTAEQHPSWREYNPLLRTERIHRYPLNASHATLLPMVTTIYGTIMEHLQHALDKPSYPAIIDELVEASLGALYHIGNRWPFTVANYPSLRFCAHQLLLTDSHNVKLFVIVVNETHVYDYFFYFF